MDQSAKVPPKQTTAVQSISEDARSKNAQLRALGLRQGSGDTAPRLQLASKVSTESEADYRKRHDGDRERSKLGDY